MSTFASVSSSAFARAVFAASGSFVASDGSSVYRVSPAFEQANCRTCCYCLVCWCEMLKHDGVRDDAGR